MMFRFFNDKISFFAVKLKKFISIILIFSIMSIFINIFNNQKIVVKKIEYLTKLTYYYPGDATGSGTNLPGLGSVSKLINEGKLKVDASTGWYIYTENGVDYLTVATATYECLGVKKASDGCYKYAQQGAIPGINYHHYGDKFVMNINGKNYNVIVADSCGECMKDKYAGDEKIDIFARDGNAKNPGSYAASVIGETPNNNNNITSQIMIDSSNNTTYVDYTTSYGGDLRQGYLYLRLGFKEYTDELTDGELDRNIDDNINEIFERATISYKATEEYFNDTIITDPYGGDYSKWKQYNNAWGSIKIVDGDDTSTIKKIGCAATSVAVQIARSGVQLSPSLNGSINPGNFVELMKQNGGFTSGGAINWAKASVAAPNFVYGGTTKLSGSNNEKLNEISKALKEGKYIIAHINGGPKTSNHWVAVTGVNNGDVITIDSGYPTSSLSYHGGVANVDQFKYYIVK